MKLKKSIIIMVLFILMISAIWYLINIEPIKGNFEMFFATNVREFNIYVVIISLLTLLPTMIFVKIYKKELKEKREKEYVLNFRIQDKNGNEWYPSLVYISGNLVSAFFNSKIYKYTVFVENVANNKEAVRNTINFHIEVLGTSNDN